MCGDCRRRHADSGGYDFMKNSIDESIGQKGRERDVRIISLTKVKLCIILEYYRVSFLSAQRAQIAQIAVSSEFFYFPP